MENPTDHAGTPLRVGDCVRCVSGIRYPWEDSFLTSVDFYEILEISLEEGSYDVRRQRDSQVAYGWFLWRFEFVSRPYEVQTRRLTVLGNGRENDT